MFHQRVGTGLDQTERRSDYTTVSVNITIHIFGHHFHNMKARGLYVFAQTISKVAYEYLISISAKIASIKFF